MKYYAILFPLIMLYGTSSAVEPFDKFAPVNQINKLPSYREGEVIVRYRSGVVMPAFSASSMQKRGMNVRRHFKAISRVRNRAFYALSSSRLTTMQMIEILKNDPNVLSAEPNYRHYPLVTPNDPLFEQQWGQHNTGQFISGRGSGTVDADMDAPEAWDTSTGSAEVVVADLDTGVDYLHPDLIDNMWVNPAEIANNGIDDDNNGYIDDVYGINAIDGSGDPMDRREDEGGHGTHTVGTIAGVGNNAIGVAGVSWNAKIMALKFLGPDAGFTFDAIECLNYVVAQKQAGVNIVATNNSWGSGPGGAFEQALVDAIEATTDLGIAFIAAAGNESNDNDANSAYPASYNLDGIISVAAGSNDDTLASFSNFGATSVDIVAPGVRIISTTPRFHPTSALDIFFDDMESGSGNWVTAGTNNTWTLTDTEEFFSGFSPVPSPTHFWSDSPAGDYANNTDSTLALANDLDLSGQTGPLHVGFEAKMATESSDYLIVEVSGNSGSSWHEIGRFNDYDLWKPNFSAEIPAQYYTANFRFRFRFLSDDVDQLHGCEIDNVGVGSGVTESYEYYSGTSMATPQVAGAYALLSSIYPNETLAQLKARLLDGVDNVPAFSGVVVSNGRLNLHNAIELNGGPSSSASSQSSVPSSVSSEASSAVSSAVSSITASSEASSQSSIQSSDAASSEVSSSASSAVAGSSVASSSDSSIVSSASSSSVSSSPCPNGRQLDQGTDNCIAGTPSLHQGSFPPLTACPAGQRYDQGTAQCVNDTAHLFAGPFPGQPSCASGFEPVQGTGQCGASSL